MELNKQSVMIEYTLHELSRRNQHSSAHEKQRVLALLTSHLIGIEPGLLFLKNLRHDSIVRITAEENLFHYFSKRTLVNETGIDHWLPHHRLTEKVVDQVDIIFIPILSFSIVSDILAFNEQRLFVRVIMEALLTGKKVIGLKLGIDPDHPYWKMQGMDKGTLFLKRKLYDQMQSLKSLGITLIDEKESQFSLQKEMKKTVVTEEMIRYVHKQNLSQLVIQKGTAVTPLARDIAKELNIVIIKE